ncbi:MAG TPA: hypothetical protein VGG21_06235 [Acidimicrobiales bacterium]
MKQVTIRSAAAIALVAVLGFGISTAASASSTTTTTAPNANFVAAQQALEAQLAARVTRLTHLTADVTGATSLSASTSLTLQARLSAEAASINSLLAKVPTDTTSAELKVDRAAMYKDNRVYAVMSPEVFEMIEASLVVDQLTTDQGNETTLQTEVTSLTGMAGYQNALNHYGNYVARISNWSARIVNIEARVLAQTPTDWPRDTNVFVNANRQILSANIALAHANYDAAVIGLASGGYTGS